MTASASLALAALFGIHMPSLHAPWPHAAEVSRVEGWTLKARLDRGDKLVLVDVRETFEWEINRIPGSKLIPLGELSSRMSELDSSDEMVFICKLGPRSGTAVRELQKAGFTKTFNLAGGLRDWWEKVDPSMPKY